MVLGMSLQAFTLIHVLISLAGIGSGLVVIHGFLANKRLDRRNDRSIIVIDALLTAACIFLIANRLTD